MDFDVIALSKVRKEESHYRANIPSPIITKHKLKKDLKNYEHFYSYRIMDYETVLILAIPDLTSKELSNLNEFFKTLGPDVLINHFTDIRVYFNRVKGSYTMKLNPNVRSYLNIKRKIYWAEFQVKEKDYLFITGDLKIHVEL